MQCMLGLLLLLVPCYVFYVFNIPLLTKTLRSFLKMAGSHLVLGVLLYEVVALDKPFFTLLFSLLIIVWGATLSIVRAKLPLRQLFLPVLARASHPHKQQSPARLLYGIAPPWAALPLFAG